MKSFQKAFQEKARLNALGHKLVSSPSVYEKATPADWLETLLQVEKYRRHRKAAGRWLTTLLWISIAVAAITFFAGELAYTAVGLAGIFTALIIPSFLPKVKFYERSSDLLCPIVALLKEDMKPGSEVKVILDCSGPTTSPKRTTSREVAKSMLMPRVRSRTEHFYTDPWLNMTGKLIDGTAFRIHCQNDTREAKTVKRSASGKTKRKTKYKYKAKNTVTLKPPAHAREVTPPPLNAPFPTATHRRDEGFSVVAESRFGESSKPHAPNVVADYIIDLFASAAGRYQF